MILYLDSSVVLRAVFNEPGILPDISRLEHAVSSDLLRVECLRTADRKRIRSNLSENTHLNMLSAIHRVLAHTELVKLSTPVLERAAQSFPAQLGTLDALHLATLLLYRERIGSDVALATHDDELRRCAQAMGIPTVG